MSDLLILCVQAHPTCTSIGTPRRPGQPAEYATVVPGALRSQGSSQTRQEPGR